MLHNLKALRRAKRLSQAELGHVAAIHQTRVSAFERGLVPHDTAEVERLARALGCTPADLMRETDHA